MARRLTRRQIADILNGGEHPRRLTAIDTSDILDEQARRCDHEPDRHDVLGNRATCFCGRVSMPITTTCPSLACTCPRPKACHAKDPHSDRRCDLPKGHAGVHHDSRRPS